MSVADVTDASASAAADDGAEAVTLEAMQQQMQRLREALKWEDEQAQTAPEVSAPAGPQDEPAAAKMATDENVAAQGAAEEDAASLEARLKMLRDRMIL